MKKRNLKKTIEKSSFLIIFVHFFFIFVPKRKKKILYSISEIRLDPHLAVDTSSGSQYGSRGALAWTPPASNEGSTPTWTEGTPSFTESSSSGEMGKCAKGRLAFTFAFYLRFSNFFDFHFHSPRNVSFFFISSIRQTKKKTNKQKMFDLDASAFHSYSIFRQFITTQYICVRSSQAHR